MFNCCFRPGTASHTNANLLQDPQTLTNQRAGPVRLGGPSTPKASSSSISAVFSEVKIPDPLQQSPAKSRLSLARDAIDFVATVSTCGAFHASELYKSYSRDDAGRLVDPVFSEQGRTLDARIRSYRNLADRRHDDQLDLERAQGRPLSETQSNAQLARHMLAVIHEMSHDHAPDQLPTNCYEKALLAFEFAARASGNPQLDVVGLKPGLPRTAIQPGTDEKVYLPRGPDHTILVIGRSPDSDLAHPATWNQDAIVCDPSKRQAYSVSDLGTQFSKYVSGAANCALLFERVISHAAEQAYDPDPGVVHSTSADLNSVEPGEMVELDLARPFASMTEASDSDDEPLFF
jgi:hypothetical protein